MHPFLTHGLLRLAHLRRRHTARCEQERDVVNALLLFHVQPEDVADYARVVLDDFNAIRLGHIAIPERHLRTRVQSATESVQSSSAQTLLDARLLDARECPGDDDHRLVHLVVGFPSATVFPNGNVGLAEHRENCSHRQVGAQTVTVAHQQHVELAGLRVGQHIEK